MLNSVTTSVVRVAYFLNIVFISSSFAVQVANTTLATQLLADLTAGYDKRVWPAVNYTSDVVNIDISFWIRSIQDFDEQHGRFSVVGFFNVRWEDHRMAWNPELYGGIRTILMPADEIWVPNLLVSNPFDSYNEFLLSFNLVRYFYNGTAFWQTGGVYITTCSADVTNYPFDVQQCSIDIVPWSYDNTEIRLSAPTKTVYQTYFIENGQWIIRSTSSEAYDYATLSIASFKLELERRSQFFVVNIVIPIAFLAAMNLFVFVLPVESGEKISYAITVLLAIAVFLTLVGDNMPKSSKSMSVLSYYLMFNLVNSSVICAVTIGLIRIHYSERHARILRLLRWFVRRVRCRKPDTKPDTQEFSDKPHTQAFSDIESAQEVSVTGSTNGLCESINTQQNPSRVHEESEEDKMPGNSNDVIAWQNSDDVTWQMVSKTLDYAFGMVFLLIWIIATAAFFSVIS
jgi:hypothetical protein